MQFQKQRENILGENDYVNLETKAGSVGEAMGVIAAVNQQPILKDCYAIQKRSKKHRERKGQLELALNLHNFVAGFNKYLILALNRSVSHLF